MYHYRASENKLLLEKALSQRANFTRQRAALFYVHDVLSHTVRASPLTLEYLHFGICQVATYDMSHPPSVIVYLKVATMLRHDLLEILSQPPSSCRQVTLFLMSSDAHAVHTCCDGVVNPLTMMLTPLKKLDTACPLASP